MGGIAPLSHRPYRNRNSPGDGPPDDGWGPLGKRGCLVVAIGFIGILIIAILIGTTRSDGDPDATDTTSTTTWVEGGAASGSRTGTPWSGEPRTLVARSPEDRWLSVAETFESLPVVSADPGPNGE